MSKGLTATLVHGARVIVMVAALCYATSATGSWRGAAALWLLWLHAEVTIAAVGALTGSVERVHAELVRLHARLDDVEGRR